MSTPPPVETAPHTKDDARFGRVVLFAGIFLVLALIAAFLLLHRDAPKMLPHGPDPAPNSLSQPYRVVPTRHPADPS